MSFINYGSKQVHCKIVFYGPSLGGKTTNMQWIYKEIQSNEKSELYTLPTTTERTLFFDFLPLDIGEVAGFNTRFHLYTVPGQVIYETSRRLILKGLDGVVFVADSQEERLEENLNCMQNLKENLDRQGYELDKIPMVIQYNKRDLPSAMKLSDLRLELNPMGRPDFEAQAHKGIGVFESLKSISTSIIDQLKTGKIA